MPRTPSVPPPPPSVRAAQYVRVSTEQQKYSIENQAAAIAAYAARRAIDIVHTYSDLGRSGVKIAGRDALQQLIHDVQRGQTEFNCILVYDISRWGRFQDVDESAYYEFICRRAGINIHYCADEFENDGSLASIVLKNIKRVAAADYSRQLSKKVFLGQCRVTTLGHWRGGTALYGLRRMLVDERGKRKALLQYMQRKSLITEHVILVPGPHQEIKIVQEIFASFANRSKTRTEIANDLNARRIRNARGNKWCWLTINNMLKNEVYLGHLIFNRRSQKLGGEQVINPREMWVRHDNAFKPIVSPELFAKAQKVRVELAAGRRKTDKELLDKLRALLRKKGRLTVKIIHAENGMPRDRTYAKRFGSIVNAYKKIGFEPHPRYHISEITGEIDNTIRGVVDKLVPELERRRMSVAFLPELYLLTVNDHLTIGMAVARSVANGTGLDSRRWEVRKLKYRRADLTMIIRMTPSNSKIHDYFVMPTANLPPRQETRLRISERHFGAFCCDDIGSVLRAIRNRLEIVGRPKGAGAQGTVSQRLRSGSGRS
jgi:DNA invertase Pin-like site-specific DNA recombinase